MNARAFAGTVALVLSLAHAASAGDRRTDGAAVDSSGAGSTTVVAPPGSGGVTVVVPAAGGGTVTAAGCSSVVVNGAPTMVTSTGAPCPLPAYQPYTPPPAPYYDARPRYARDPDRTGALIGASIGFGVGASVAGMVYLIQRSEESSRCSYGSYAEPAPSGSTSGGYVPDTTACSGGGSRASLLTYGAIVTFVPSLPRFVVGDNTKGLVYTGLRGVSFAAAALVDWGGDSDTRWQGPFLLGFVAPITLGIVDLASTPHREDLEKKLATPGVTSLAPVALSDRHGKAHGAMLSLEGLW
jgi:hypothetical protein